MQGQTVHMLLRIIELRPIVINATIGVHILMLIPILGRLGREDIKTVGNNLKLIDCNVISALYKLSGDYEMKFEFYLSFIVPI